MPAPPTDIFVAVARRFIMNRLPPMGVAALKEETEGSSCGKY
jgi:hypothetical protein